MARRHRAEKRPTIIDPVYSSPLIGRLISTVMRGGKKAVASRVVYAAIDEANKGVPEGNPLEIVQKAFENVKPRIEVKSRRVGGATYQIPMEVPIERQLSLAMRWIVGQADKRKGMPMARALAAEIKEASLGQGAAIKKRDDVHRMAQANRAFAHLRW
jgi:small subunit ribosomal protein S7